MHLETKILCDSLRFNTCFIAVVWTWNCSVSEVFSWSNERTDCVTKDPELSMTNVKTPIFMICWCLICMEFSSAQSLSHVQLFETPRTVACSGLPVHHQFPVLTQTHVHWVGDAIQPSHPLSSPSLPAFKLSQHQGLFQWVISSHQVAKVMEFQLQH